MEILEVTAVTVLLPYLSPLNVPTECVQFHFLYQQRRRLCTVQTIAFFFELTIIVDGIL
jgi:hypothetical protein